MDPANVVNFVFRPMRLEDVEQVYAIDVQSFSLPWSERAFRKEVAENPSAVCWAAEALDADGRGEVAAMIVVWLILDEAHIGTLAAHPAYRRRGVGRRLLACALLECAARGAQTAMLEVRRSNLAAQALYQSFGFEVVGERRRYYVDNGEDALLMTLQRMDAGLLKRWAQPNGE